MNKSEQDVYRKLLALVKGYDKSNNVREKEEILLSINDVASCDVSKDFIDNYWTSISLEEFCEIHAIIREDIQNSSAAEINTFIDTLVENKNSGSERFQYFLLKYQDAIEFFYRKNSGAVSKIFEKVEYADKENVLYELKNSDVVSL